MKFLHLMDPIDGIDITKDTTFAFITESQDRDHENWYCAAQDLTFRDGEVFVSAAPLKVNPVQGDHARIGERSVRAASDFDCIFMRKDPPFDTDFFFTTQLLSLVDDRRTFVFNKPSGLREASEKVFIVGYPDLIAETIISTCESEILSFRNRVGGDIVVKPLDGCGGAGIFRLTGNDLNTHSILETATANGTRAIMAQRFLPESRQGDTRLLYLDGKALAAVTRVPQSDDLRGNIHVGGRVEAASIAEHEHQICQRLAPALNDLGIYFAGLDIIGGYLTEVNVTSPTGIQEAQRIDKTNYSANVIDMVEAKVAALVGI